MTNEEALRQALLDNSQSKPNCLLPIDQSAINISESFDVLASLDLQSQDNFWLKQFLSFIF